MQLSYSSSACCVLSRRPMLHLSLPSTFPLTSPPLQCRPRIHSFTLPRCLHGMDAVSLNAVANTRRPYCSSHRNRSVSYAHCTFSLAALLQNILLDDILLASPRTPRRYEDSLEYSGGPHSLLDLRWDASAISSSSSNSDANSNADVIKANCTPVHVFLIVRWIVGDETNVPGLACAAASLPVLQTCSSDPLAHPTGQPRRYRSCWAPVHFAAAAAFSMEPTPSPSPLIRPSTVLERKF